MSDNAEEDLSAIAWPGFVDILSAVIIMFVFFVMIVATALYFHTIIYKSKILVEVTEQVTSDIKKQTENTQTYQSLVEKIDEVTLEKEVLEKIVAEYEAERFQARSEFEESKDQEIEHNTDKKEVIIFFGKSAISLTKETQEELRTIIQEYIETYGAENMEVQLAGSLNPIMSIENAARQITLARTFNVRNSFLETDFPPENISPKMVKGNKINGNYNWVRVVFIPK